MLRILPATAVFSFAVHASTTNSLIHKVVLSSPLSAFPGIVCARAPNARYSVPSHIDLQMSFNQQHPGLQILCGRYQWVHDVTFTVHHLLLATPWRQQVRGLVVCQAGFLGTAQVPEPSRGVPELERREK